MSLIGPRCVRSVIHTCSICTSLGTCILLHLLYYRHVLEFIALSHCMTLTSIDMALLERSRRTALPPSATCHARLMHRPNMLCLGHCHAHIALHHSISPPVRPLH